MRVPYPHRSLPAVPSSGVTRRGRRLRALIHGLLCAAAVLPALAATSVLAAELVVVDQAGCPYCERFEREIAPAWPNTAEGREVPLRRVNLHSDWPADLADVVPATLTPTFILVEDGAELGRLVGYAGDEHFWFLIGQLLEEAAGGEAAGGSEPAPAGTSGDAGGNVSTER